MITTTYHHRKAGEQEFVDVLVRDESGWRLFIFPLSEIRGYCYAGSIVRAILDGSAEGGEYR